MRESKMSTEKSFSYKLKTVLWHLMMCILMIGGALVIPLLREGDHAISHVYVILVALLVFGTLLYAGFFERKTTEGILFWLIPVVYVISYALLLLVSKPLVMPFWCFGGILLLCAFKIRYGMFLNYFFLFLVGSMQTELSREAFVIQVLSLLLLGIVMPYAKSFRDTVNILISLAAVIVSVRIVCFFVIGKEQLTNDIFAISAVYAAVVIVALVFSKLLQENHFVQAQNENFDFLEELAASAEEHDADVLESLIAAENDAENKEVMKEEAVWMPQLSMQETAASENDTELNAQLEALCAEEAPLLTQLSKRYAGAYLHANRVALLASEIAERLDGVNALLVKCGGFYHEIGRLRGKNTLENTLAVAEQEGFPAALKAVLREHTVTGDKPTSKEAAVVLLTDNICSMCEYLRKTQKGKILVVKVIDKALNLRITKEDLSISGLTVKEFSIIRNTMAEVIKEDMF